MSSQTKVTVRSVFDSMIPNLLQFSFVDLIQNWQFLAKNDFKLGIKFTSGKRGNFDSLGFNLPLRGTIQKR